jgi:hypothetical protein
LGWLDTVFEIIDMRSFSNLWYWIAVAVVWSMASHWVLGVPYDMVLRARRLGGQTAADLEMLVVINCNRMLFLVDQAGLWLAGLSAFYLSALAMLAFWYEVEFAQAVLLILGPLTLSFAMSVRTARRLRAEAPTGEVLWRRLHMHRLATQVLGMISIFLTAFWGLWHLMNIEVLGK